MLFLRVFQEIRGIKGGGSALRGRYWFPLFPFFFLSSFFFFFFLELSLSPFFFFFFFTGVDTGVRDSEFVIPEGAVGSVQAAGFQTA